MNKLLTCNGEAPQIRYIPNLRQDADYEYLPFSPVTFKSISRRLSRAIMELSLENETEMAIEIKGLKAKALAGSAVFDRLNRAYDKLIETGSAHASDVEGLAPQIDAMQDDITFAVQTLGNSAEGSERLIKDDLPKPGPFPSYPTVLKTGTGS
jgi:hypothetical protein